MNVTPTTSTVSTNTFTVTSYGVATQPVDTATSSVTTLETETSELSIQPVIGLTSTEVPGPTIATTTLSSTTTTETLTSTTTLQTTVTGSSTLFTPFAMYFTEYTSGGYGSGHFYRSVSPISATYSDATLTESFSGSSLTMTLSQTSNNGYDLGFYYVIGTLSSLASGNGLTIDGTGNFGVNIWLISSLNWSPISTGVDQYAGGGTYGLGSTQGAQTINGNTVFNSFQNCNTGSGPYSVNDLIGGACSASGSTLVAIWVGVGPLGAAGTISATVNDMYLS
ncbi:MAG TPA: hypothetical protein VFF30_03485 [Nitrososphaerales archaeon]|nr:hypothetical protein [Nitrososphaerales archaeon]